MLNRQIQNPSTIVPFISKVKTNKIRAVHLHPHASQNCPGLGRESSFDTQIFSCCWTAGQIRQNEAFGYIYMWHVLRQLAIYPTLLLANWSTCEPARVAVPLACRASPMWTVARCHVRWCTIIQVTLSLHQWHFAEAEGYIRCRMRIVHVNQEAKWARHTYILVLVCYIYIAKWCVIELHLHLHLQRGRWSSKLAIRAWSLYASFLHTMLFLVPSWSLGAEADATVS